MTLSIRPIVVWPGELRTSAQRIRSPFQSPYSDTMTLLERELRMLRARVAVVQLAVNEGQVRRDGGLYARAMPDHPGVILSFDTKAGHFRYAADRFTHWHDNLRAIALGLEALRKIERYGIGSGTEQYTGFLQLDAGPRPPLTVDEAVSLFAGLLTVSEKYVRDRWWDRRDDFWRTASKLTHPDTGGDAESFKRMREALRLLDQHLN
jgi:hypothetical protein